MDNPYLVGEKVYLRLVKITDATLIQSWHNDSELRKLAGSPKAYSTRVDEEEDIKNALESEDEAYLMIVKKANNDAIGFIRLNNLTSPDRNVWLRIIIGDKSSWGNGYGSEALRCVLHWLFNELNIYRVELETYATNERAINFFEHIGFKREGIRREAHFTEDGYEDVLCFGLLKKEFNIQNESE